jgi:hypothetical protein
MWWRRGKTEQRYTRAELLAVTGARSEELAALERDGVIVPNRAWQPWGRGVEWYGNGQRQAVEWLIRSQRLALSRRMTQRP